MDRLWEESGYQKMYLGEWHTHREPRPVPSGIDIFGWASIARRRQNAPWMLFLILGQTELRLWTIYKGEAKELIPNAE
jgi:integrative and conjugative element protein (TIGR02256 family)